MVPASVTLPSVTSTFVLSERFAMSTIQTDVHHVPAHGWILDQLLGAATS